MKLGKMQELTTEQPSYHDRIIADYEKCMRIIAELKLEKIEAEK